jgi:Tfp pilus assembly protein PilV
VRRKAAFSLIETAVAVALLAVIVVSILSALSIASLAATRHQQQTTLDRLTRSDAEYIKSQAYSAKPATYTHITAAGYSFSSQVSYWAPVVGFSAANPDIGLQQILLTVGGPNSSSQVLYVLKVQP